MSPTPSAESQKPGAPPGFLLFLVIMPCFALVILTLLGAMQYKQLKSFLSPNPVALGLPPEDPAAQARVLDTLRAFLAAPGTGGAGDTLALGAEQVNRLVESSKALKRAGWTYRIDLEDSVFSASNSLPVQEMKGPASLIAKIMRMHGYLNSVMRGTPKLDSGRVELEPLSATMNGIKAPASVLSNKGNVNTRDWVEDKGFYDEAVGRLAEVKVAGSRLLLIKRK